MSGNAALANRAVAALMLNDIATRDAAIKILLKVLDNLQTGEEKFRRLKSSYIVPRLQSANGALDILR